MITANTYLMAFLWAIAGSDGKLIANGMAAMGHKWQFSGIYVYGKVYTVTFVPTEAAIKVL